MANTYSQIYIQVVFARKSSEFDCQGEKGRIAQISDRNRDRTAAEVIGSSLHARPYAHTYWLATVDGAIRFSTRRENWFSQFRESQEMGGRPFRLAGRFRRVLLWSFATDENH